MKKAKTSFLLNLIVVFSIVLATSPISALAEAPAIETASAPRAAQPQAWETLPAEIKTKIDPRILAELRGEVIPAHMGGRPGQATIAPPAREPLDQTRFLVYLEAQTDLKTLARQSFSNKLAQRTTTYNALVDTARATQGPVKTLLETRMTEGNVASFQPFYIFNGFAVEGDLETIVKLAQRDDVERIAANYPKVYYGNHAAPLGDLGGLHADNWNIDLVDAERVWDEYGITGEGAVVAVYDTGADWDHTALIDQYRGWDGSSAEHDYDWFETDTNLYPDGNLGPSLTDQPTVYDDHGTHVLGTMVGDGGTQGTKVGMAPGAQWIALADQLNGSYGDDISTHKAFQWLLAPTDLTGQLVTANPALAPDVVNCSWGIASPADDFLEPDIAALRAAGIAVVFSSGNPSAGAGSIGSPGSSPSAITVGATDIDDNVVSFSGRGPSFWQGVEKPDLSAPGLDIKSTTPDDNYEGGWGGTSMAAPLVSGLVALMISADLQDGDRSFNVDEIERFMEYTAVDLGDPGHDNDYGHGRIDAYSAVSWLRSAGDLRGSVSDAATSAPLYEATVTGVSLGDTFGSQTDASGQYSTTVPAGVYDVAVEAWGYYSDTFPGQTVITGALSVANFALNAITTAQLTGQVLDNSTPVSGALVYIADAPHVYHVTGAGGDYTLSTPTDAHSIVVEAPGYRVLSENVSVDPGGSSHDFNLTPAPTMLLVDADRAFGWFYGNPVMHYIGWALDYENYLYDEWEILDPFRAQPDFNLAGVPPTTTLRSYDVVIWAHGGGFHGTHGTDTGFGGSPRQIGANDELEDYLDAGGRLILSGQDIAFWDDTDLLNSYMHADHATDRAAFEGEQANGAGFLEGLTLELTDASRKAYPNGATGFYPDAVTPQDGSAYPVMTYDNGSGSAILAVAPCDAPYRAVYVAAGLEAFAPRTGPIPEYAAMLDRSIAWLEESKPDYSVSLSTSPGRQTSVPGNTAVYDLQIINTGAMASAFELNVSGNAWSTRILSDTTEVGLTIDLPPCSVQELTLEVNVPPTAGINDQDTASITATPHPGGTAVPAGNSVDVTTTAFPAWQMENSPSIIQDRWMAGAGVECTPYAIGGAAPATSDTFAYEFGQWVARAPKPTPFFGNGAEAIDGKIYVPGGYTNDSVLNWAPTDVLEIYDPATNTWTIGAPMPRVSGGHSTAVADGKLYVFGGAPSTAFADIYRSVLEYDPATDAWTEKRDMPYQMLWGGATGLGDKIYAGGDYRGYSSFYEYDPAGDTWARLASFPDGGRKDPILVGVNDQIYLYGGDVGAWNTPYSTAFVYDPASNIWSQTSSPHGNHRGAAGAFAGGKLWVFGNGGGVGDVWTTESLQLFDDFCTSSKSAWQSSIEPGERITYTVEIHSDLVEPTEVSMTDPIPAGTTFAGFGINAAGATYNGEADQVEWSGNVPAQSAPLTFTFGVDVDTAGWTIGDFIPYGDLAPYGDFITNVVTFDDGAGLVFDRSVVTVIDWPNFSVSTKQVNKHQALAGDVLTYTLYVENISAVSDVFSMRDPIPAGATYVPGSLAYSAGAASYDPVADVITWTGTLPQTHVNTSGDYEWGDSNGNGVVPVDFDWVEISDTGTPIVFPDSLKDDHFYALPFNFKFYDTLHTNLAIGTNGTVYFENLYLGLSNTPIPRSNGYGVFTFIAHLWDDLLVSPGAVYYEVRGRAPNRHVVIEYYQVSGYGAPDHGTWEVILYENGAILMQYQDVSFGSSRDNGAEATIGIQGNSSQGIQYSYNTAALSADLAIVFLPDGAAWRDGRADVTFAVTTEASLPINTWITNTATITEPHGPVERSANTLVNPVELSHSTKTANPSQATVGDVVTYDFVLQNTGMLTATGASLSDPIPTPTTYVPGSLTCDAGVCSYASGAVTWNGDIAPGGSVTLTFAVTLTTLMSDMTPVTNTAALYDGFGERDDLEAVFWARSSDLSNSLKVADPAHVEAGSAIAFTVYIYNSGLVDTPAEMRDELPPELTYVPGSLFCHSGTLGFGSCSYDSGVITWTGTAPAQTMVPVRFQATAPASANHGDLITNSATITDRVWMSGYPATTEVMVVEPANLRLTKNGRGTVDAGGTLVYTLTYGNDGPYSTLEPVEVLDVLSGDVTYVGSLPEGILNGTLGTLTWELGALEAGVSGTLVLTAQVNADTAALTVLENAASITAISQDLDTTDNSDQVLTVVGSNVNLLNSTKTADPPEASPGEEVAYTISLVNTGNLVATVMVTDPIPNGAVYVRGSGELDATKIDLYDDVANAIKWQGALYPNDTVTIRFRAQMTATSGTTVINAVAIDDGAGMTFSRQAQVLSVRHAIYLPLVLSAYPPPP